MKEETELKNQLLVSVFCYILAVGFVLFNILSRIGFTQPFAEYFSAAGLSFFFCSLGTVNFFLKRKYPAFDLPYVTLAMFAAVVVISFLPSFFFPVSGYVISVIGWLLMLYVLYLTWKTFSLKHHFYFIPTAVFFAVWCVSTVYYHDGYVTPLFREGLAVDIVQVDLIHNMSIAQMIKTYGVVSTGLDGLVMTPYHYGSHWIFARLSVLFNSSMIEIYNIFYPVSFITLFYYWLIQAALKRGKYLYGDFNINLTDRTGKTFWLLFFLLIIGFLPIEYAYKFGIDRSNFNSQSYLFSLIFLFIALCILHDYRFSFSRRKQLFFYCLTAALIILIYVMKLSVGFLLMLAVGYLQLRHNLFFNFNNFLVWGIFLFLLFLVHQTVSSAVIVEYGMFDYIKRFTDGVIRHYFVPIYFIVPILYVLIRSIELDKLNTEFNLPKSFIRKSAVDVELILIVGFISLLPGNLMVINGNSGNYFSDVPRQVANIMVLAATPFIDKQFNLKPSYTRFSLTLVLIFTFGLNAFSTTFHHLHYDIYKNFYLRYAVGGKNTKIRQSYKFIQNSIGKNPKYIFIKKLDSLNKLPIDFKRNFLINIPRKDTAYYNWAGKWQSGFIIPAISGIAMINGLPSDTSSVFVKKGYYNFVSYRERKGLTWVDTLDSEESLQTRLQKLGLSDKKILTLHTDF